MYISNVCTSGDNTNINLTEKGILEKLNSGGIDWHLVSGCLNSGGLDAWAIWTTGLWPVGLWMLGHSNSRHLDSICFVSRHLDVSFKTLIPVTLSVRETHNQNRKHRNTYLKRWMAVTRVITLIDYLKKSWILKEALPKTVLSCSK